jgi:hypothetical protein
MWDKAGDRRLLNERHKLECWSRYRCSRRMCSWGGENHSQSRRFVKEWGRTRGYAPCLDLCARDTIRGSNVVAGGAVPRADGLGATMVGLRRDTDHERGSRPDAVTVHVGVVCFDVSRDERMGGLDAVTVE